MRVFKKLEECCQLKNPVVTIGTFDGLHLGHQQILKHLKQIAQKYNGETLVITFWPHPRHVVDDKRPKLKLLNTMDEKYQLFEQFGIDNVVLIPFTKQFANQGPDVFIKELIIKKIKARAVVIGYDHRFGRNRSGSFEYLYEHAEKFNFSVEEVKAFEFEGDAISSTKIRNYLENGQVHLASKYLGYNYSVSGSVIKGLGLGKDLGYPTANIDLNEELKLLPAHGIYVCSVDFDGRSYYGMMNIGNNPTIKNKGWSLEVNVFDFEGDLYGKELKISFLKRLRDEMKFINLDELTKQMHQDKIDSMHFIESIIK